MVIVSLCVYVLFIKYAAIHHSYICTYVHTYIHIYMLEELLEEQDDIYKKYYIYIYRAAILYTIAHTHSIIQ